MEEIYTRLFVGGEPDYRYVRGKSGWSWLRCTKEGYDGHRDLLGYESLAAPSGPNYLAFRKNKHLMALNLIDVDDPNLIPFAGCISKGLDFVKERWDAGDKILIACEAGRSRAPSVGLMFLRAIGDLPHNFVTSEKIYRVIYQKYDPAMGIRQTARSNWDLLNNLEVNNA